MPRPTAYRLATWAAVGAGALLAGTAVLCAGILDDGGVPGAAQAGSLVLLLVLAIVVGALAARKTSRRPEPRGFEPVLPANLPPPQSPSVGDRPTSVPDSDQATEN